MLLKPQFRFVGSLILMQILFKFVCGYCDTNCHWTAWFAWDCARCCRANLPPPVRFALRARGICCHNITDTPQCLKACGYTPTDTMMKGPCVPNCECPTTPVYTSLPLTQTRTRETTVVESTSSPNPSPQSFVVTTDKQAGLSNLSSTMAARKVLQACSTASVGSALDQGLPPLSSVISSALSQTGHNDTLDCRKECTGVDGWDTCLLECFSRPCTSLLTLVSPCLFVLGLIVGSSLTCIIRSLLDKRCKKKSSFVHA